MIRHKSKNDNLKHNLKLAGCDKIPLPDFIPPALGTLVSEFPRAGRWLYEIKFDGYRIQAIIKNHQPILKTRTKQNWSNKFNSIVQALKKFPVKNAVLDGELVVEDKNGISRFQLLQNAIQLQIDTNLTYYIFDLLYCDGYDLTNLPLWQRRQFLEICFAQTKWDSNCIQISKEITGDIKKYFKPLCQKGYEGVIAKDLDSTYQSIRSKNWLKIKCSQQQEFVIGGYTDPTGAREAFGALLLGYFDKKHKFIFCGKVGTGFNDVTLKMVFVHLKKYAKTKCPFSEMPPWKNAHWVKPILVAEVKFQEWTEIGYLRQPVFLGLRFDKPASEISKDS